MPGEVDLSQVDELPLAGKPRRSGSLASLDQLEVEEASRGPRSQPNSVRVSPERHRHSMYVAMDQTGAFDEFADMSARGEDEGRAPTGEGREDREALRFLKNRGTSESFRNAVEKTRAPKGKADQVVRVSDAKKARNKDKKKEMDRKARHYSEGGVVDGDMSQISAKGDRDSTGGGFFGLFRCAFHILY